MFRRDIRIVFIFLTAFSLPCIAFAAEQDHDTEHLKSAGVNTDDTSLLKLLKRHTPPEITAKELSRWLEQLGSPKYAEREEATRQLGTNPLSVPLLRANVNHADAEIARRVKSCLQQAVATRGPELCRTLKAATRVLAARGSEGATTQLIELLPGVLDEELEEEIWFALDALAVRRKAVDAGTADFLKNSQPLRRAAAGYLLARRGDVSQRAAAGRLLTDPDPMVRLRVAQGLLGARDTAGIPVLIELLETLPSTILAWQAEELLRWTAWDRSPDVVLGVAHPVQRRHCRETWQAWSKTDGKNVNLADENRLARRPLMLLVGDQYTFTTFGCDGVARWFHVLNPRRRWSHHFRLNLQLPMPADVVPISTRRPPDKVQTPDGLLLTVHRRPNGHDRLGLVDAQGRWKTEVSLIDIRPWQTIRPLAALVQLGFDAGAADFDLMRSLPYRLAGLKSKNVGERLLACLAIRDDFGPKAAEAAEPLLEILAEEMATFGPKRGAKYRLHDTSAEALSKIGKAMLPVAEQLLRDPRPSIRAAAAGIMVGGYLNKTVPFDRGWSLFTGGLRDPSPLVRYWAVRRSQTFWDDHCAEVIRALAPLLCDKESPEKAPQQKVNFAVALELRNLCSVNSAEQIKPAIPILIEALRNKEADVASMCLSILVNHAQTKEPAMVPMVLCHLSADLKNRSDYTRIAAATNGVHRLGPAAKELLPDLMAVLNSETEVARRVRPAILSALGRIGPDAKVASARIIQILKHSSDYDEWRAALSTLDTFGDKSTKLIEALEKNATSQDPEIRSGSLHRLWRMRNATNPNSPDKR